MQGSQVSNESEDYARQNSKKKLKGSHIKGNKYTPSPEEVEQLGKQVEITTVSRQKMHEAAMRTKSQNQQLINELMMETKEMEKIKDENQANKKAQHAAGIGKQTRDRGKEMTPRTAKKLYDDLHEKVRQQDKLLQRLKDKLQEVSGVKNAASDENPLTRQIRILENKLDKIMIKYNEAQSIRKTYEQIVKRLKEERIGYDNQLAAIERSLKGKEHDYVELLLLSHDATHAKELAISELRKYELKKKAVASLRRKYINEKRKQIENKRNQIDPRKTGNLNHESTYHQNDDYKQSEYQQHDMESLQTDQNNNIKTETEDYEEGLKTLFKVTGVSDVNEVIQKYRSQDETMKILKGLEKNYQETLENLENDRRRYKEQLNEMKYGGGNTQSRKKIDTIEADVKKIMAKCERFNQNYQRISKILVDVRAGVEHLNNMVGAYVRDRGELKITEDNLPDTLKTLSDQIKAIYRLVKADQEMNQSNRLGYGSGGGKSKNQNDYRNLYDPAMVANQMGRERHNTDMDDEEASDSQREQELDMN